MKKKTRFNFWKLSSILLLIITLFLYANLLDIPEVYNFNGLEIEKETFETLVKEMDSDFSLCDIENNVCRNFIKKEMQSING